MKNLIAATALLFLAPGWALGQSADRPPRGQGYFFFAEARTRASFGASSTLPQIGGGGEWISGHGLGLGGEYLRTAQSWEGTSLDTRIGSIDISYHFRPSRKSPKLEPFVTGGFSFFYVPGTGLGHDNGGNFGAGLNIWLSRHAALRLEIRDDIGGQDLSAEFEGGPPYYLRSSQHLVGFRIGVTFR